MTEQKLNRCIICKISYDPASPHQRTCGDSICKYRLKRMNDKKRYQEKALETKIALAEEFLAENGYLIMPPQSKYRIILEPIQ